MRRLWTMVLFGLFICSGVLVAAVDNDIAKADELWRNRREVSRVEQAISLLETKVSRDTTNYEALWRLGRYYQYLGDNGPKKTKLAYYQKGLNYAAGAIKANSLGVDGHLEYGILLGCVNIEQGIIKGLSWVRSMQSELQTTLKLDPQNARAHSTLALLYWKAPVQPLSIGDKRKALTEALLAVKQDPKTIYYWLIYGQIANANKEWTTARDAYGKVLELPLSPDDPNDEYYKSLAEKDLEKIPQA